MHLAAVICSPASAHVRFSRCTMLRTLKCPKVSKRYASSLSYKHLLGDAPLLPMTIGKLLEKSANDYPDRMSIIAKHEGKSVTFPELLRTSDKLAAALRKLGLKKGDRVGIWSPNSVEWESAFLACNRTGLIPAQLNPGYVAREMLYCINKVGIKCIVCPDKTDKHNFYEVLQEIDPKIFDGKISENIPTLEKVVVIGENTPKGAVNFTEIQETITEKEVDAVKEYQDKIGMDSAATIMFTSGSTGNPKAALLSHHSLVNNSYETCKRAGLGQKHQKILVQVPFFHTFGATAAILGGLNFGATLVLPSLYYNPEANIRTLESEKCSVIYGTPTMYVDLINKQKEEKRNVVPNIAFVGGAPTNPKLIEDMYNILGVQNAISVYGLTETTAVVFQSLLTDKKDKVANTLGYISTHTEVKIVDPDGNIVPCGTPGELMVRGYTNMLEYYDDEENTKKTIGKDGWLKTGDKVVLSEDGYGKIIGRLKDMIIRGGENIYPKEIEDFLSSHPKILECQVVGIPHERLGEEVCVCVRLKAGTSLTPEEMKDFCKNQIANYKIPSKLFIMEVFPKTTSGKIQKFRLVEMITRGEVQETRLRK